MVSLLDAEAAAARGQRRGRLKLLPVALHGGMSSASQASALQPTPRTHRKVNLYVFRCSAAAVSTHAKCFEESPAKLMRKREAQQWIPSCGPASQHLPTSFALSDGAHR